jgi:hypothetical protein
MALKINGTTIVDDSRNYSTTDSVQHGGAIIISDILTLAGEGYKAADGNKVITDQGITFNNYVVEDGSILLKVETVFQGTISGYTSGGRLPADVSLNTIDKFPFAADGNATDVGDLTLITRDTAGQSSTTHGYTSGGYNGTTGYDVIAKFSFVADANATDVGNLTQGRYVATGQSSSESGYTSGGLANIDIIDKFPFVADTNATDVGNLTVGRKALSGQNSKTHGYNSGGLTGNPTVNGGMENTIDKFPFATDGNATDVGDLTIYTGALAGQSSTTHGYTAGGYNAVNVIQKFTFATDGNSTDVGDLTQARVASAGQSSTDSGYTSGGRYAPTTLFNTIDKFPFSNDVNATDVGDLTIARYSVSGQQV